MNNDKYVVFKREDFNKWAEECRNAIAQLEAKAETGLPDFHPRLSEVVLSDAVVIRPQDIFAGPGLSAYAACIQTLIDLNHIQNGPSRWFNIPFLQDLRDFFFNQAQIAFDHPRKKVPD